MMLPNTSNVLSCFNVFRFGTGRRNEIKRPDYRKEGEKKPESEAVIDIRTKVTCLVCVIDIGRRCRTQVHHWF